MRVLFLLFIVLPIAELMLLIKVGQTLGVLPTVALVLLTAATGVWILRRQSVRTLQRAQRRVQAGEVPGRELLEGFLISVGGALLLAPGFLTDLLALVLLLPFTRRGLVAWLFKRGGPAALNGGPGAFVFTRFGSSGFSGMWPPPGGADGRDIYEGEFSREERPDEQRPPLPGPHEP